jgi:hypothetical protein
LRFSRAFFCFLRSFRQRLTGLEPRPIASDPNESGVERESGVAAVFVAEEPNRNTHYCFVYADR